MYLFGNERYIGVANGNGGVMIVDVLNKSDIKIRYG